jgi:predicted AAA+ superfamily ATPase
MNYLAVLEAACAALVLRPYSTRKNNEITAAPKVYGFDTGFACHFRGWTSLRPEDLGRLWEHYVLNELCAHLPLSELRYWRDKQGHEVDFLYTPRGRDPIAIECKWTAKDFDASSVLAFARAYPQVEILVVTQDAKPSFRREFSGRSVRFLALEELVGALAGRSE